MGARACPRVGLQPAPGRLGYQSPGTMTGAGGASLDWDRRRRVTPVQTTSQEAWPEADLGDGILSEMRAVVERRQACALQKGARRIARCGGCYPAVAGVPLPSIYFRSPGWSEADPERRRSRTFVPGFRCAQSGLHGETGVSEDESQAHP